MRRIGTMVFVATLLVSPLAVGSAKAQAPNPNEPYPVELQVGEIFKVCLSGQIVCPARAPICDDLKVVSVVDTPDGLGFKGIAPGSTLCSAMSGAEGIRRVFRITVR